MCGCVFKELKYIMVDKIMSPQIVQNSPYCNPKTYEYFVR